MQVRILPGAQEEDRLGIKVKRIARHVFIVCMISITLTLLIWFFHLENKMIQGKEMCFRACPGARYDQVGNLSYPANFKFIGRINSTIKCMCFTDYEIVEIVE